MKYLLYIQQNIIMLLSNDKYLYKQVFLNKKIKILEQTNIKKNNNLLMLLILLILNQEKFQKIKQNKLSKNSQKNKFIGF